MMKKDTFIKDWEKWADMTNKLPLEIRVNSRRAGAYSIQKSGMLLS